MGLDISYASKIKFESRKETEDDYNDSNVFLYPNDSLLDQSEGIPGGTYICEGMHDSFRAGTYSGYSAWRKALAKMAGWEIESLWETVAALSRRNESLNEVLVENDRLTIGIPFVELLHFSDCEGFIGPNTSKKLHADFLEWDEKAKSFEGEDSRFYSLYKNWTKAFEVASDGGSVMFH